LVIVRMSMGATTQRYCLYAAAMAVGPVDTERSDATGTTGLAIVGGLLIGAALWANPATIEDGPLLCPFRRLTGLPCPFCGLTRSWVYLMHGDWVAALKANPFGYVTLGATLGLIAVVLVAAVRRRRAPSLTPVIRSRGMRVLLAVWLAFALVRLVVIATG
jgi:hypothetical protein